MINKNALIDLFERMKREHWAYEWGGAREGCVDCSGAFVYAYKQLGGRKLEHSSNYIARRETQRVMYTAEDARPGWAAFKWHSENETTPDRWKDGQGDYYHIGLVGRNGEVLEAHGTSAGFISSPMSRWDKFAPLNSVGYDGKEKPMKTASVHLETSRYLNLRVGPGTEYEARGSIPNGATVEVKTEGHWPFVCYNGQSGYVCGDYLVYDDEPTSPALPQETTTLVSSEGVQVTLVGRYRVLED